MAEFTHDEEGYCGITFEDLAEICPNLHCSDLDIQNDFDFTEFNTNSLPPSFCNFPSDSTPFTKSLHRIAIQCIGNSNFGLKGRRLFWSFLLLIRKGSSFKEITDEVISSRSEYWNKVKKFERRNSMKSIQELDPQIFHPLAPAETNPWSLSQKSKELMDEIWQDIERTYQERSLFQRESVRKSLQRILFVWSMEHNYISYKQGMNELLAIIYITCYRDQFIQKYNSAYSSNKTELPLKVNSRISTMSSHNSTNGLENTDTLLKEGSTLHPQRSPKSYDEDNMFKIVFSNNEEDIEADSYVLFNSLMSKELQMMYDVNAVDHFYTNFNKLNYNPLISRCNFIYNLLKECDNKLYMYLKSLDLEPHLFLIRWIRLLFSREFNINETLNLWDFLLSDYYFEQIAKKSAETDTNDVTHDNEVNNCVFDIINYFSVAMIIFIKSNLLENDLNGCLQRLFKYPPIEDISLLTNKAIFLKYRNKTNNSNNADTVLNGDIEMSNEVESVNEEFVDACEFGQEVYNSSSGDDDTPKSVVIKLLDDSTVVETPNSSESETFDTNLTINELGNELNKIASELYDIYHNLPKKYNYIL
ncbi:GTPase activator, putative [Theileria annulata]|uniref:GTPase activator, putative n=1 Tax=Theileria annulata TaxID=5874 RepID=Q4UA57_THEAN|nr:GTPase activator, putative [Theileria annulata]CAI76296.1 GTPase activator, putative [Theileria annulata]|eukprot:XP_952920.1 GTPase activator, putative [Theileria annulata]